MATLTDDKKFGFKYTMVDYDGRDPLSRTVSGFNINSATVYPETGVTTLNAINFMLEIVSAFTMGRVTAARFVTEQEVTL